MSLTRAIARRMPRAATAAGIAALAAVLATVPAGAQTRPSPAVDPGETAAGPRPVPGPVYETAEFSRAVARGTRTRAGRPGASNWVQHARYAIEATLDATAARLTGRERVVYLNRSPDTLREVAVYLRQNVFAPGAPRRDAVPVTGGVTLTRVAAGGETLRPMARVRRSARASAGAGYRVDGTIMWVRLPRPLLPHDSATMEFGWSYSPAPSPSDGREGREGHDLYFMGYWYPQLAVYDDVHGWVTDPYTTGAEFYMDPADYDVRVTVPHGWVVGATGTLANASAVLSRQTRDRLAAARRTRDVVHVVTAADRTSGRGFVASGKTATWHFTAPDVRDFAWGTSDRYDWDATIALVPREGGRVDTVAINSYFTERPQAAAWPLGGARFTRDAIEQLSAYLWPYPWPAMSSFEGVLTSGGMEYPMATLMQPWADTLSLAGDLMHETGHMWFPMQVGSNETRHPWMDEGFTQFDVAQAMRVLYGEPRAGGRPNDSEQGQRRLYLEAARAGHDQRLMQWGDLFPSEYYFIMYYDKTAQVLAALRGVLGDSVFHRAYREYGRRWIDRHPMPEDFFNTVDDVSGRDLSWFWESWFYEPWSLDQAIASVRDEGDSTAITIEDRGLAPMPVLLAVTRAGGAVERLTVPVDAWLRGERRVVVRVPRAPAVERVEIDPDGAFPDVDRSNQLWKRATAQGG